MEVTYFVTFCVQQRRAVLNNEKTWRAIRQTFQEMTQWHCSAAVAMPDHLHLLISPLDRDGLVGEFSKYFKRLLRERIQEQWQPGCFDRLLRSTESLTEKWMYMRENPVRANLVQQWSDWPYQFGFTDV